MLITSGFMIFVRLVAHINHNWRLLFFQRSFSRITGMLFTLFSWAASVWFLTFPAKSCGHRSGIFRDVFHEEYTRYL